MKKRFFDYLVFVTEEGKTILEKREGKGIWKGLYQFPVIEMESQIPGNRVIYLDEFHQKVPQGSCIESSQYGIVIHKLSHQHLYTRFWIIQIRDYSEATILWDDIQEYPVPVLISNFLDQFDYKSHQNF